MRHGWECLRQTLWKELGKEGRGEGLVDECSAVFLAFEVEKDLALKTEVTDLGVGRRIGRQICVGRLAGRQAKEMTCCFLSGVWARVLWIPRSFLRPQVLSRELQLLWCFRL